MPSKENREDLRDRLEALDLYLSSLEQRPEVAAEMLKDKADPISVRQRLALLLQMERLEEAAELVRSSELDRRWYDLAVVVLVRIGEFDAARNIVTVARKEADYSLGGRTALNFATELLLRSRPFPPEGQGVEEVFRSALEILRPDLVRVRVAGKISTELESNLVQAALEILKILEEGEELREWASYLEARKPVPLPLAQAALSGWVSAPPNLADRLRQEHPESVQAQLLAIAIDGELFGRMHEAIKEALRLTVAATTLEDRQDLGRILLSLSPQDEESTLAREAEEISRDLLRDDATIKGPMKALRLLRAGKAEEAKEVLEERRNEQDPHWLQAYAGYAIQKGDHEAAVRLLQRAASLIPHPNLLRRVGSLAYEAGLFEEAAAAMESLVKRQPDDVLARRGLAAIYWDSQRFEAAARQFEVLAGLEEDVEAHRLNQASCYLQLGDAEGAFEILDGVQGQRGPGLDTVLQKARLLKVMGRPREAFEFLAAFQEKYWDNAQYLVTFIDLGYGAEEEAAAHEAMLRVLDLQERGVIPEPILEPKSLDEVREHLKNRQELRRHLYDLLLRCRAPWLVVDGLLGQTPYWSWRIRTQALPWVAEDRDSRAAFAIPATNSFSLSSEHGRGGALAELKPPEEGQALVADLSALLTLHRLGLLEELTKFAGTVYVPSRYLSQALEERSRLMHHQPSRARALKEVKRHLDAGKLFLLEDGETREWFLVDEFAEPSAESGVLLRALDVLNSLHEAGRLRGEVYQALRQKELKPESLASTERPLGLGTRILVELETLRTFAYRGVLDAVLEGFEVYISDEGRRELVSELEAVEMGESLWRWHEDLWNKMRELDGVVFAPGVGGGEDKEGKESLEDDFSLAALRLSKEQKLPLLADDRVLQASTLNEVGNDLGAAFGTDVLLIGLWKAGRVSNGAIADAFLRLIEWRYRFVLVPQEILLELASRYAEHPPGKDLRAVAVYVHDCMADPSLLAGFEQGTSPPLSMAQRLFLTWSALIAELIIEVWADARFSDDCRSEFTMWACRAFLPSPPYNLGPAGGRLSELLPAYILRRALVRSAMHSADEQMNKALRALSRGLGLSETEYTDIIAGVVYGRISYT